MVLGSRLLKNKYHQLRLSKNRLRDQLLGGTNYKKFVIISDARTGSTLLLNLLGFHPHIETEGERFKNINGKSQEEIWNDIFRKRQKKLRYVGFKLFYFHAEGEDQWVWDRLKRDRSITIIHLTRDNILRSLISKKIGLKTKIWTENVHNIDVVPLEDKKIYLDTNECRNYLEEMTAYQGRTNKIFANHTLVHVSYEELAKNTRGVIDNLYNRLGVKPYRKDSQLKKQNPESIKELVANIEDLKKEFKGSRWETFFK
jgi:LPS sulfotransferase NodH